MSNQPHIFTEDGFFIVYQYIRTTSRGTFGIGMVWDYCEAGGEIILSGMEMETFTDRQQWIDRIEELGQQFVDPKGPEPLPPEPPPPPPPSELPEVV